MRCYADAPAGPRALVVIGSTAAVGLHFPRLWSSPAADRAWALLATRAPSALTVVTSTRGGPATVMLAKSEGPEVDVPRLAAGFALAQALVDRGELGRFQTRANIDAEAGLGHLLAGAAELYAEFTRGALLHYTYNGSPRRELTASLGSQLDPDLAARAFATGGDPAVRALLDAAPAATALMANAGVALNACLGTPPLGLDVFRYPSTFRAVGTVEPACLPHALLDGPLFPEASALTLAVLEAPSGATVLVWALRSPSTDAVQQAAEFLISRGVPAVSAIGLRAQVVVAGATPEAQAIADSTLAALEGR